MLAKVQFNGKLPPEGATIDVRWGANSNGNTTNTENICSGPILRGRRADKWIEASWH